MANPMMNQLNMSKLGPIKQMFNAVRSAGNPMLMLSQLAQSNPMLGQVMNYVQQNGGDAQAAFYKLAKERGVDPETILQQLR